MTQEEWQSLAMLLLAIIPLALLWGHWLRFLK
jgi:hypothetical protein